MALIAGSPVGGSFLYSVFSEVQEKKITYTIEHLNHCIQIVNDAILNMGFEPDDQISLSPTVVKEALESIENKNIDVPSDFPIEILVSNKKTYLCFKKGLQIGKSRFKRLYFGVELDSKTPCSVYARKPLCQGEKIQKESQLLKKLEEVSGVVRLYETIPDKRDLTKCAYVIVELCQGGSVIQQRDHLSFDAKIKVARQMIECVAEVHEKGVCHGDLAPGNFFLTEQGDVRLGDFGSASLCDEQIFFWEGTPFFMAPELYLANKEKRSITATHSSDLWSLGRLLFWWFSQEPLAELSRAASLENPSCGAQALLEQTEIIPREFKPYLQELLSDDPTLRPEARKILGDFFDSHHLDFAIPS